MFVYIVCLFKENYFIYDKEIYVWLCLCKIMNTIFY